MKILPVVMLLMVQLVWCQYVGAAATATNDDYACAPISQSVKPNIHLVLDFSGSMGFLAYPSCGKNYIGTGSYFGYFKSDSYYKYNVANGYWEENDAACSSTTGIGTISSGCLYGNFLNFATTTRINVVRKILTGGKFDTATNKYVDEGEDSNYNPYADSTTHCKITITAGTSTTRIMKFENDAMTITAKKIEVSAANKTFKKTDLAKGFAVGNVITTTGFTKPGNNGTFTITGISCDQNTITVAGASGLVDETSPNSFTAKIVTAGSTCAVLGTALSTATYNIHNTTTTPADVTGVIQTLYPAQADLELLTYSGSTLDYTVGKNKPLADYVSAINGQSPDNGTYTGPALEEAQKYFKQVSMADSTNTTLMVSVADPTKDPYYDTGAVAVKCRKAFVLLISDGQWSNGTTDPVIPAYYMHMNDLRSDAALPDAQTVNTYTVYAFGDGYPGRNALIYAAMWGGFIDGDGNRAPYPFATVSAANMASGTYAPFGSNDSRSYLAAGTTFPITQCNPTGTWSPSCTEWADPLTGLPYNYFEGADGDALKAGILSAVNSMLGQANSGTAASAMGSAGSSGAVLLQTLYYPEKELAAGFKVKWFADLQGYWYYVDPLLDYISIREDSVQDKKLNLTNDKIADFYFDGTKTQVNLYADANGDGAKDGVTPSSTVSIDAAKNLFSAGTLLASMAPSARTIFTSNPTTTSATKLDFQSDNTTVNTLYPYMDTDSTKAIDIINFARGTYNSAYRDRRMNSAATIVWKLGDIVNSTPKIQSKNRLNGYNLLQPGGFSDQSYGKFINSKDYSLRGTAYVGANDGMLHAFKVGSTFKSKTTGVVAELKNPDESTATELGKELWAFIPKHTLPYLQYLADPSYKHIFMVDAAPLLIDASINTTFDASVTCADATYSQCVKKTTVSSSTGQLSYDTAAAGGGTSWRTVLLGATGMGGAASSTLAATATGAAISVVSNKFNRTAGSFITDGFAVGTIFTAAGFTNSGNNGIFTVTAVTATVITCSPAPTTAEAATTLATLKQISVKTPISTITNATSGFGFSSIFALDVTNPITSDLTSGTYPKLMWEFSDPRLGFTTVTPAIIRIKDSNETSSGLQRNGKWYVIVASGPTGPIANNRFYGYSDKKLTIFVLDLRTGALVRTFSSAATGGINTNFTLPVDAPAFAGSLSGSTTDTDKFDGTRSGAYSDDAIYIGYTRGNSSTAPTAWNVGGVVRLLTYNDPNPANWEISNLIDGIGPVTTAVTKLQDSTKSKLWLYFGTGRNYFKGDDPTNVQSLFGIKDPCFVSGNKFDIASHCTTSVTKAELDDRTTVSSAAVAKGWYIDLPAGNGTTTYSKRVITDPAASTNGVVSFTTFTPAAGICDFGGSTSLWALRYDTAASGAAKMKGQILVQLSTGAFQQVDMASAFTQSGNRETTAFQGAPPKMDPLVSGNTNHRPSKRFLHIQER